VLEDSYVLATEPVLELYSSIVHRLVGRLYHLSILEINKFQ